MRQFLDCNLNLLFWSFPQKVWNMNKPLTLSIKKTWIFAGKRLTTYFPPTRFWKTVNLWLAFKTKHNVSKFLNIFWNLPRYEQQINIQFFWVKSFRFIISKANHLKSIIAWSPVSNDQNYCICRIQPNT